MSHSVAAGARIALLIVTDTYTDSTFSRLRAPRHDATALAEVLSDPEIGGYQVSVLENQASHAVRVRIERLFRESARDALILLYVSGHGIKDETGRPHLATTDTEHELLASTSIPALWVRERIDHSPARKVVVWLDCCYGGAFPSGMVPKAEGTVDVLPQLSDESGRGCAVMTASTHIQFAFEPGETFTGQAQPSVFTNAIVEGLRTGDADRNTDGEIDANELYNYVYDRVRAVTPGQTPTRNLQLTGEIYIARSRRGLRLHPDLPAEIRQNLRSTRSGFRRTAVMELAELARTGDAAQRAIATETLNVLRSGPDTDLAQAAEQAISPPAPAPRPTAPRARVEPLPRTKSRAPARVAKPPKIELPHRRRFVPRQIVRGSLVCLVFAVLAVAPFILNRLSIGPAWLDITIGVLLTIATIGTILLLLLSIGRFLTDTSVTLVRGEIDPAPVAFRPDGNVLVCAGQTFSAWHTPSWVSRPLAPRTFVTAAAFSPDGSIMAISAHGGTQLWNGQTLTQKGALGEHEADSLVFAPSGEYLASATSDLIRVWNTASWTVASDLSARFVRSMAFSPDGRILAAATGSMVRLWSTSDWKELSPPRGRIHITTSLAFSPDGTTLAAAGYTGGITLWNVATMEVVRTVHKPSGGSGPVAFSPDGDLLACQYWNGIKLLRTTDWSEQRRLVGHQDLVPVVTSLTFSPDGSILASTSYDGTLKLWRIKA